MKIGEPAEDYLEAILVLSKELDFVRAIDVCSYFGYARATVSVFMKQLRENNLVNIDDHNHITLTPEGESIALRVYERHLFLTKFFTSIGVPASIAAADACRVEHDVSNETFAALKEHFRDFDN